MVTQSVQPVQMAGLICGIHAEFIPISPFNKS
jgi:hypothetical protein